GTPTIVERLPTEGPPVARLPDVGWPRPRAAAQLIHLVEHPAEEQQVAGLQHPALAERGIRFVLPGGARRARSSKACRALHSAERPPRPRGRRHPSDLVRRRRRDREFPPRRGLDGVGSSLLAARPLVPAGVTTSRRRI